MLQFTTSPATAEAAHAASDRAAKRPARLPVTARLADAMLEITGAGHIVDAHALSLRGFVRAELTDDNIAVARDIANRRTVRQVA